MTAHISETNPALTAGPDHDDLEQLLRRYHPGCLRVALRVTRDHHHAQDAVQEAFMAFWRQPARFDSVRGSVGNWLAMLTHRRAVDIVRREQLRGALAAPAGITGASEMDDPETQALKALEDDDVSRLLCTLDAPKRQIIYLAYYLGYTQSEIAALTGIPVGTVKSRTSSALRQLRSTVAAPAPGTPPVPALAR